MLKLDRACKTSTKVTCKTAWIIKQVHMLLTRVKMPKKKKKKKKKERKKGAEVTHKRMTSSKVMSVMLRSTLVTMEVSKISVPTFSKQNTAYCR